MRAPLIADPDLTLYLGDALAVLAELETGSADCVVTSPPYLDARPEYPSPSVDELELIFRDLARVVSGPALVNVGRLWRGGVERLWWIELLRAAERAGWSLLDTRIWIKPNANPIHGEVFADSHEYVLVLGAPGLELNVDAVRTEYALESVRRLRRRYTFHVGVKGGHPNNPETHYRPVGLNELGARPRSFIVAYTGGEKGNPHPAPMPLELAANLVELASWPGQTVLDPFAGSGTTLLAARRLGRRSIGIELDVDYAETAARRTQQLELEEATG